MTKKEAGTKKTKKEQTMEKVDNTVVKSSGVSDANVSEVDLNHPNKFLHAEALKEFEKNKGTYGAEDLDYKLENNEVYDEAELASALESSMLSKALKDHKQKMAPQKHPNFDGLHCLDCEEDMHPDRLKMGRIRCTDCQEHHEYLEKRKGY